jgi:hypothetical protein
MGDCDRTQALNPDCFQQIKQPLPRIEPRGYQKSLKLTCHSTTGCGTTRPVMWSTPRPRPAIKAAERAFFAKEMRDGNDTP